MKKLFILLCALLSIAACGTTVPKVDSVSDALVVTSVNIKTLADQVLAMCGNTVPGGDCLPGALIDNGDRDRAKSALLQAQGALENAYLVYAAGGDATDNLSRAESILLTVQSILEDP